MTLNTYYPDNPPTKWSYGMTVLPTSTTTIVSRITTVNKVVLSNISASAVSVTITDNSTEASGSPCQLVPAISVAANTVEVIDLGGVIANGGVSWFASAANAIHGWIKGAY